MKIQIFKPYEQNQAMLLPLSLDELISPRHLVWVLDGIIGGINPEPLINQCNGGGTSACHPKMLLKVIIYAFTQRTFSSRRIAKECRENVNFMCLSGMNLPDHRTISPELIRMKEAVREYLNSPRGKEMGSARPIEVKAVFGRLTQLEFPKVYDEGIRENETGGGDPVYCP